MVAQPTYSDPITSIPSSTNIHQTNELANVVPPYYNYTYNQPLVPPGGIMAPIDPITDEMFDRYLQ